MHSDDSAQEFGSADHANEPFDMQVFVEKTTAARGGERVERAR